MAFEVLMPQMGESISEGTLTKWHKKVGDKVEREEILFEISTDKVDTEIPSPTSGYLAEVFFAEGAVVTVNSLVAKISEAPVAGGSASKPADVAVATVQVASTVASSSSSAASASLSALPVVAAVQSISTSSANAGTERVLSSPLVRKMATEHGVDLGQLKGSGESGRINKSDLMNYLDQGKGASVGMVTQAATVASSAVKTAGSAGIDSVGGVIAGNYDGVRVERVPMTNMRRKIAEHMVMSKRTSPHVTSVIEVDLQKIVDLREKSKNKFEAANGFKLSFMPFFMHACLEAIKAVPIVNASVEGDVVVYKKDINLGIAVALDWGLIVPVIKNTTEKSFVGLARDLNNLAEKARTKKLAPDDVKGGTFSISNFGGFGTIIGQPIINQPQVAIMGIGAMSKKAVVVNDAIAIRTCCYVVLSFDHRVIDGSDSGKFLSTVKSTMENWILPVV
jgi:2-oxoglutarate dehydrogenase complex dihydrolipoamide succinyltransferase (E2) component